MFFKKLLACILIAVLISLNGVSIPFIKGKIDITYPLHLVSAQNETQVLGDGLSDELEEDQDEEPEEPNIIELDREWLLEYDFNEADIAKETLYYKKWDLPSKGPNGSTITWYYPVAEVAEESQFDDGSGEPIDPTDPTKPEEVVDGILRVPKDLTEDLHITLTAVLSADGMESQNLTKSFDVANRSNYRFQSFNYPTYYIKHYAANSNFNEIKIVTDAGGDDAYWHVKQGLSEAGEEYVSLESKNYAGYYLRQATSGTSLILAQYQDTDEFKKAATFKCVEGLWDSRGISFQSVLDPTTYIRHYNYILKVENVDMGKDVEKQDATFGFVKGSKFSSVRSWDATVVVKADNGVVYEPGDYVMPGTRLYVESTPAAGHMVYYTRIYPNSANFGGSYIVEIRNGGYFNMPAMDIAIDVYAPEFTPQPEAFNHPGIGINLEMLENMKQRKADGDRLWVDAFNKFASYTGVAIEGSKLDPRIFRGDSFDNLTDLNSHLHPMVKDSDTAYAQTIMWYVTGNETYRGNAMKILRGYMRTNSILNTINDDRIRVSLAVTKFCVAAEIMRYVDTPSESLKWTEADTKGFTDFLLLMKQKYDRNWHYMNQHNMCVTATMASAIFRNDVRNYEEAVERATTNPYRCSAGALCDRNKPGGCDGHDISGDILSQIRLVTYDHGSKKEVEPNIQLIELGRDIGHAYCDIGSLSFSALTSYIQDTKVDPSTGIVSKEQDAVNMFEFADHRLLAGAAYISKYNLGYDVRYVPSYQKYDVWGNKQIFYNISYERGGPEKEDWARFDPYLSTIYNYYRYFQKGQEAVLNDPVVAENLKFLGDAYIRLYPEGINTDFMGAGNLLTTYESYNDESYDLIDQWDVLAEQVAYTDSAKADEVMTDSGYAYISKTQSTYIEFDLNKIQKDWNALTTLGIAGTKDGYVYIDVMEGTWEAGNLTHNVAQGDLAIIYGVQPLKRIKLGTNAGSLYLIRDVIYELQEMGKEKVTFRLYNNDIEPESALSILTSKATDNRHRHPRISIQKLTDVNLIPTGEEFGDYTDPGQRLFEEKTNFADWGYVSSSNNDQEKQFKLNKLNDGTTGVSVGSVEGTLIYYLGEGDLTDLESIQYWGGYGSYDEVKLFYSRRDDDYIKSQPLNFPLGDAPGKPDRFTVKRYTESSSTINNFIWSIDKNIIAEGWPNSNSWNYTGKVDLYLKDNLPKGRYKVYMTTPKGNPTYIKFKYKNSRTLEKLDHSGAEKFGTVPWSGLSEQEKPNFTYDKALDGNPDTFYGGGTIKEYVGIHIEGNTKVVKELRYLVRPDTTSLFNRNRVNGAVLQGSHNGTDYVTLGTADGSDKEIGVWYTIKAHENKTAYEYMRLYKEDNTLDVAEIEFYVGAGAQNVAKALADTIPKWMYKAGGYQLPQLTYDDAQIYSLKYIPQGSAILGESNTLIYDHVIGSVEESLTLKITNKTDPEDTYEETIHLELGAKEDYIVSLVDGVINIEATPNAKQGLIYIAVYTDASQSEISDIAIIDTNEITPGQIYTPDFQVASLEDGQVASVMIWADNMQILSKKLQTI